jgi:hypothetical protein
VGWFLAVIKPIRGLPVAQQTRLSAVLVENMYNLAKVLQRDGIRGQADDEK